jgi:hypothetical protein
MKAYLNFIFLFFLISSSGCIPLVIGAAAGAGGIGYAKGALAHNIDEPVERVYKASLAALKDFKAVITFDELTRHSAIIRGEYPDGQKLVINVEGLTEFVSKITIRIGVFGDQEDSRLLLSAIQKKL